MQYSKNLSFIYCRIGFLYKVKNIDLPVIMLDSQSEILEFETEEEALKLTEFMNANTDSGHKYSIKKIG